MRIAMVGFTNSYNDLQWLTMARDWLAQHDPTLPWASATHEIFDLRWAQHRNFLDDSTQFDIVILFAIYNPPPQSPELLQALTKPRGQTSLAANHSRANWNARLARTAAKYLFVFRRDNSINGQWLGEIHRYRKHPETATVFGMSIYQLNTHSPTRSSSQYLDRTQTNS